MNWGNNFSMAAGMSHVLRDESAKECTKILGTSRTVRILFNEPGTHALYAEMIQYRRKVLQDAVSPCHMADSTAEGKFFLKLSV